MSSCINIHTQQDYFSTILLEFGDQYLHEVQTLFTWENSQVEHNLHFHLSVYN